MTLWGFHFSHVILLSFLFLKTHHMPHQRNIPQIPWEKFHSHAAVSPATSSEYEIRQREWMGAKLPLGVIGSPIKNILQSWKELVWLHGSSGDQPNSLRPVMLSRNDLVYLPGSIVKERLSPNVWVSLLITTWPLRNQHWKCFARDLSLSVKQNKNPPNKQRTTDKERVSFRQHNTAHKRLTKHHINLQVHLIVGKLNAALSEGGDQYIELVWLTTSNPANLLEVLKCCIGYLNYWDSTA